MTLDYERLPLVREIASGVDALYMSARGVLDASLAATLETGRAPAGARGAPSPLHLSGEDFAIHPSGMGRYRAELPTLRIQPRAEFLHAQGPRAVAAWFGDLSADLVGAGRVTIARLDLFSDWQGWSIDSESRRRLVTRAR